MRIDPQWAPGQRPGYQYLLHSPWVDGNLMRVLSR
jgi:hypothetical protein